MIKDGEEVSSQVRKKDLTNKWPFHLGSVPLLTVTTFAKKLQKHGLPEGRSEGQSGQSSAGR